MPFMQAPIITLLTDFGISDIYVGLMKGVITQICPESQIIDLTHQIPPQNIAAGRFCLMSAFPYFPDSTVHLGVVDPGVGTQRRGVALRFPGGYFVGPDNGLCSGIVETIVRQKGYEAITAIELTNPEYWRLPNPSRTFHGRDIFAPAAAHIATGAPLEQLGHPIDPTTLINLNWPEHRFTESGLEGCVQYVDQFGNLITNIPGEYVEHRTWFVAISELTEEETEKKEKKKKKKEKKEKSSHGSNGEIDGIATVSRIIPSGQTYSDVQPGHLVALIGSHGWVEIAANQDSAQAQLLLDWGERVQILLSESSS